MSEFQKYVCWRPEVVARTVATEAITSSDSMFLATHAPLKVHQLPRGGANTDRKEVLVTEGELLRQFLDTPPKEGVLVAPVLGESGSGKSHLIRWVFANIPEDPSRRVIYLPKTETSLRDVVTILLSGQEGPEFTRIRSQVDRLGESVDEESLQRRILDELAEALRVVPGRDPYEKALVGENGLALLIHDNLFREYMLRPNSFVVRRAAHAMHGRDTADLPLQFTVEDLPLDIENAERLEEAGLAAQRVFRRLSGSASVQQAAVQLLNDNLDVAVTRAAFLGVGDMKRAFLDLRRALVGKEIILLVEDFALIQGVQRDLLDAIVEAGRVKGVEQYATIRTLMAVTTGYYNQLDATFRTRTEASSPVYSLDMHLSGSDGVTRQEKIDFVARYLNAARLGEEDLFHEGKVVNACDQCAFRDACHGGFGKSGDGYGLYPYNADAIETAVQSVSTDSQSPRFNPRMVLARAVRDVLVGQASEIRAGAFPGQSFSSTLPSRPFMRSLGISDGARLEHLYDGDELTRHRNLLVFWGGAIGLKNLNQIVHDAFGVSPLSFGSVATHPTDEVTPPASQPRRVKEADLPPSLVRDIEAIVAWRKGKPLQSETAREIRGIILDAIKERCTWTSPVVRGEGRVSNFLKSRRNASLYVSIDGASENLAQSVEPFVRFSRSDQNAQFFQGLLAARSSRFTYHGVRQALAQLEMIAERKYSTYERLAVAEAEFDESLLAGAIRSQLMGAALCGIDVSGKDAALEALFWGGGTHHRGDENCRIPQWLSIEDAYCQERGEVSRLIAEACGVSQGTGAVHAVDLRRLQSAVQVALKADAEQPMPKWAERADRLRSQLQQLIPHQLKTWEELDVRVRLLVPPGVSFPDTVRSLSDAANEAAPYGLVKEDMPEVSRRNGEASRMDFNSVTALERLLSQAQEPGVTQMQLASIAGTDIGPGPCQIDQYLQWANQWVDRGLQQADQQDDSEQDLDVMIRNTVERWVTILKEDL